MSQLELKKSQLLEDFFYTFAEFYKYPTKEFYEEITSGKLDEFLREAISIMGDSVDPNFQQQVPSLEDLQENYMNCFSGIVQPFAPAVESVYKVWTNDPTAQVSIAKSKGYIMGDCALHMKHLLKQYQIELPEGYENTPDHLTIILEFCAYLQKNATDKHLKIFVNDHLDWLHLFEEELMMISDSFFYVNTTSLLREILEGYCKKID